MIPPWARLSTPDTPKISVKPTAARPYNELIANPSTRIWIARMNPARPPNNYWTAEVESLRRHECFDRLIRPFCEAPEAQLGVLTKDGKLILALHLSAGQTQVCLPFCH